MTRTPPEKTGRPQGDLEAPRTRIRSLTPHERADLTLRIAWLREHARQLYDVDPGGQLSAQLRDLAHLLEALDRDGEVTW